MVGLLFRIQMEVGLNQSSEDGVNLQQDADQNPNDDAGTCIFAVQSQPAGGNVSDPDFGKRSGFSSSTQMRLPCRHMAATLCQVWECRKIRDPVLGSLYEGSFYVGSISGASDS